MHQLKSLSLVCPRPTSAIYLEVELDGADHVSELLEGVPQVRERLREVGVDPDALLHVFYPHGICTHGITPMHRRCVVMACARETTKTKVVV